MPSPVRTADDFVAELRQLRVRAGNPSLRQLSRLADQRIAAARGEIRPDPLPPSTTSEVLAGKRLPRLPRYEFVESFVTACLRAGGQDEPAIAAEVARWRAAWCTLSEQETAAGLASAGATPAGAAPNRPRRGVAPPLVAVIFVAGIGVGVLGARAWPGRQDPAAAPPAGSQAAGAQGAGAQAAGAQAAGAQAAAAPDTCLPSDHPAPAGPDVLSRAAAAWWANDTEAASVSGGEGHRFRADVATGTKTPGDVVIVKSDVDLVQGRPYTLAFTASTDRATTIRVRVQDSPPTYQESYTRDLPVDTTACRHEYRFVAARTSAHSELTFQVGGHAEDFRLEVADVALVEAA
ncbi:carbohydrate binding domain-containing protein [Paractinoplanes atraurantiacus]|uniref:Carbohydrate binding domain-containing protein n=1 Tax=Paractinoplanes atraurantiacus TaxID=1036182 RepID=A0A285KFL6_9ACTN|nr:carbohydrate binding domain-containing protein [Actinoplanes atraurantiacus]SNY70216.1 Carbohydrate binding domain-containing protein [Actinoplanes atraurantiacus]